MAIVNGTNNSETIGWAEWRHLRRGRNPRLGGQDTIYGLGGDDVIYGGDGNDFIRGGRGDDVIYGGGDTDTVAYDDALSGVASVSTWATPSAERKATHSTGSKALADPAMTMFWWATRLFNANVLSGLEGDDQLLGLKGDDRSRAAPTTTGSRAVVAQTPSTEATASTPHSTTSPMRRSLCRSTQTVPPAARPRATSSTASRTSPAPPTTTSFRATTAPTC